MDDSDVDFSDLCSRLLKRVRRNKADEKKPCNPPKRRKKTPNDGTPNPGVSQPTPAVPEPMRVKDAVIRRMQQFKRANPERLLHGDATASDENIQHTGMMSMQQVMFMHCVPESVCVMSQGT